MPERKQSREFWEWFRVNYGDELTEQYQMVSSTSPTVASGIFEQYDYWKTNVLSTTETPKETPMDAPLTPEENYLADVGAYLKSEVESGRLSETNLTALFNEAKAEIQETGLIPSLKYFKDQNFKTFIEKREARAAKAIEGAEERRVKRTEEFEEQGEEREKEQRRLTEAESLYGEKSLERRRFEQDPARVAQEEERVRAAELEDVDQYAPDFTPDIKGTTEPAPLGRRFRADQFPELTETFREARKVGIDVSREAGTNLMEADIESAGNIKLALQKRIATQTPIHKEWQELKQQAGVKKRRSMI